MPEPKTNFFHIRFKPTVRKLAAEIAEQESRSIASYIEWLILKDAASRAPSTQQSAQQA